METKPFQNKPAKIICIDEKVVIDCYSNTLAHTILSCARMANNPKYHAPASGWDEEDLQVAKCLKGRKLRIEKYSHMNFFYLEKRV